MPEVHDPGKKQGEKRRFINEKVVKQPLTKKQKCKRILMNVLGAAAFGAVAAVSFVLTRPLAERYLAAEEETESSVSIPKDEVSEPTAAVQVQSLETEPISEAESEPVEKVVQSALEEYRFTIDDVGSMLASMRTMVQKADKGIVVVHSVQKKTDWFDNPVEKTGLYAGAVIADTRNELLILTRDEAVEYADSIKVTFPNGTDVNGQMKQKDQISGMAVVSVKVDDIDEETRKSIQILPLGNSYTIREGDLIAAVGSPAGKVHSVDYGLISYVMKNVPMVDQMARIFYSDICADVDQGTFMINSAGELVGWAMKPHTDNEDGSITEIMGISDYKGILEKLTNGIGAPAFGIIGQEVSEVMEEKGLPKGIYVIDSVTDGPAYRAGIQNGDVITKINGEEITSMKEFQILMEKLVSDQVLDVTVERNGREVYTELQFQITVGIR